MFYIYSYTSRNLLLFQMKKILHVEPIKKLLWFNNVTFVEKCLNTKNEYFTYK